MDIVELTTLVENYNSDPQRLLDIFWDVQAREGYVSATSISQLAKLLAVSEARCRDTLSFYHFFLDRPMGDVQIYLNSSIMAECHQRAEVLAAFEEVLNCTVGEVDPSGKVALLETACIGMSDQEPAALIDFMPFPRLTADSARLIAQQLLAGVKPSQVTGRLPVSNVFHGPELFLTGPYQQGVALKQALSQTPEQIISKLIDSQLRGRGGAGFVTGKKWQMVSEHSSAQKYIVCNADEGEPGTFKDRYLLSHYFGLLMEGMAIAAFAVGANQGVIYLRAEYRYLLPELEAQLAEFAQQHYLGERILGRQNVDFSLRIQLGAGAYVCGEESALLESLEGRRGEPRLRPPFPVDKGYKQQPTVINNVETFCTVARIIEKGHETFLRFGTPTSKGTRLMSVSGDVKKPGIYEFAWGVTVAEFLSAVGAIEPQAIQIGGPSGHCVSAQSSDVQICFEGVATGGSMMVFGKQRALLEVVANFQQFFIDESCGCCTPCRAGNVLLKEFVGRAQQGKLIASDLIEVKQLSHVIKTTSRCGLGGTSSQPIMTSLANFPELYQTQLMNNSDSQFCDFDLDQATAAYDALFEGESNHD